MLPAEFLKKIRQVEIRTRKLVNTMFAGEYKSTFKGTGIEFLDVREYLPGDDIRTIDWKVTARMGRPYVKKFAEDRELTVILCIDASGSGHFSTRNQFKLEQAADIAATLAFSAVRNNDKVGLLFFTDKIEKFVPPKKGRFHVLRLIRDILYFKPEHKGTRPVLALEFLTNILKRHAIIFFVSDFIGKDFVPENLRIPLGIVGRRHDLVVITITDPAEEVMPRLGLVQLEDAETDEIMTIDTSDSGLLTKYGEHRLVQIENRRHLLQSLGIDKIDLSTSEDFTPKLHKFFQERARKYR
jgi:uncharacterized protein (DUF58 family)